MLEVLRYLTESGRDLVRDWLDELHDARAAARIVMRIDRLANGSFGDCKPIQDGVWELRIDYGRGLPRLLCDGRTHLRAAVVRR